MVKAQILILLVQLVANLAALVYAVRILRKSRNG